MDFIKKKDNDIYIVKYQKYIELFLNHLNIKIYSSSNGITFKADRLEKLESLDFSLLENFIYDLGYQILILKNLNLGILFINISDIIVINSSHFLFINPNVIFPISSDNNMNISDQITNTLSTTSFISPEIKNIKSYPTNIYYTSSFYSLASLILHIFNIKLENLYYTSSYYFLTRCLVSNPHERYFLYI